MATTQSGRDPAAQPDDAPVASASPASALGAPVVGGPATQTSPLAHALGLLQVTHPLPSLMYVVAVGLFSFLAAASHHQTPSGWLLARAMVGVLCAQFAIGALNDYHDRAQDAQTQPTKPLARGVIAPWEALAICVVGTVGVIALLGPLGVIPCILGLLIEGLGVAYDLWFKGTLVSAFLYAVYFPLIPLLAWALFGGWQPFLPWLIPFAAPLGVAMNIANTLPDLEGDLALGARGLPHLLGLRRGLAVAWLAPVAALALIWALALTRIVPAGLAGMLVATAAVALSVGAAVALYVRKPQPATLKLTFYIQALGVVALAGGWLAAVAL